MTWDGRSERRRGGTALAADSRGGLWSLSGGRRLPSALDGLPLAVGDPSHPARLTPEDLDNPETYHLRLTSWLLGQG